MSESYYFVGHILLRSLDHMVSNPTTISITTAILCRDNFNELVVTLDSVFSQSSLKIWPFIEILIVDGSKSDKISDYINKFESAQHSIVVRYVNSTSLGITGIYPSMNLALDIACGQYIHFLNSGDTLLGPSLYNYALKYCEKDSHPFCFFGQAFIHGKHFCWIFPDIRSRSINLWLQYFEPNHQAMLVHTDWSRNNNRFLLDAPIGADAVWKRKSVQQEAVYYPFPVVNFYLGGQSSSYSFKGFKTRYSESWRNPLQKFLEIVKFLLFRSQLLAEALQMVKNRIISFFINFL